MARWAGTPALTLICPPVQCLPGSLWRQEELQPHGLITSRKWLSRVPIPESCLLRPSLV